MASQFIINGTDITADKSVYTVAEMSANHNQDYDRAVSIIEAAAESGADAIKLQTYRPGTLTLDSKKEHFKIDNNSHWDDRYLFELYEEAYTPWEWQEDLQKKAHDLGLDFFSTAFDGESVDFLEDLDVPVHKIASFEIVDLPLIEKTASTGKPLIISTGMATLNEIHDAVRTARDHGAERILLLKCTSSYPANYNEMNLRTIPHMADTFDVPVGLSDHSEGHVVPVTAVSQGICLVEKHFTLSRDDDGPDSHFSMEPAEFRRMVDSLEQSVNALGSIDYGPTTSEKNNKNFRRSLFVVEDLEKNQKIDTSNVEVLRPGSGLPPRFLDLLLGKKVTQDIERGTPLKWTHVLSD